MSGRYVTLGPGRYTLAVSDGEGPAGVHRNGDRSGVVVDVDGGRIHFSVNGEEEVYYWWRGPAERPGVRLLGVTGGEGTYAGSGEEQAWPTGTMG